jgi:catechol 2,3-dioxygenase-like lactoylglutathione lyase family enzyme
MSFNRLKITASLLRLGYKPFEANETYLISTRRYMKVSIHNLETDPIYYTVESTSGNIVKAWSFIFDDLLISKDVLNMEVSEDDFKFKEGLFINEDGFIIKPPTENDAFYQYKISNVFTRPTIEGIDPRLDLGDINFIVSDAGILFSTYEFVHDKLVEYDYDGITAKLVDDPNNFVYLKSSSTLGESGNTHELYAIRVFPKVSRIF